ncbi:hypothetical protein PAHAL_7G192800 [Panicum hallii]|uniref:Uncharacterized protein n=1 Tax=Panicum hallii TaxID=206008 RepID=A0A2T8ICT5_9POAL|nr:hypothetical protein PAHAL_7G192800 [Panicum hallii]
MNMFQDHTLLSACLPSANVFLAAYPDHHRNSDSTTTSAGFPVGAVSRTASRRISRGQGSQAQIRESRKGAPSIDVDQQRGAHGSSILPVMMAEEEGTGGDDVQGISHLEFLEQWCPVAITRRAKKFWSSSTMGTALLNNGALSMEHAAALSCYPFMDLSFFNFTS